MLGGELGADQERRAEGGDLGQGLVAGPEGEGDRESGDGDEDRVRRGSRPSTWPQMLKGESRSAW